MKRISILFLLIFGVSTLNAQNTRLVLSEFKESSKIDSLLNTLIDQSQKIYLSFLILNVGNETTVSITEEENKQSALYLPLTPSHVKPFGYFKFRGHIIFIFGDTDINHFFKKTSEKKPFKIVWYDPNNKKLDMDFLVALYKYKNGQFLVFRLGEE